MDLTQALAEIDRLTKQLKDRDTTITDLNADLKEARGEARDRRHELKTLNATLGEVTAERDTLRGQAGDPDARVTELERSNADLTGQVRGFKFRNAFDAQARAKGVREDALDDLWMLSKVAPDADEPDAGKLGGGLDDLLRTRSWALKEQPQGGAGAPANGTAAGDGGKRAGAFNAAPGGASGANEGKPGAGADRGTSTSTVTPSTPGRIPGKL